jgi:lysozyme
MKKAALILVIVVALTCVALWLIYAGVLRLNYPSPSRYPVRGIDVSHHQGEIDWAAVRTAGVSFVFMKATEGADFQDPRFERNWSEAGQAGIPRGAYHFFTFCTPGRHQAENFTAVVPAGEAMLPPAVDIEFAGNCKNWSDIDTIRDWLTDYLGEVERAYGTRPVLYVTRESYARIVEGHFDDYPLWVRRVLLGPKLDESAEWIFWQYTQRGKIPGIAGHVDLDVYSGGRAELEALRGRP